MEAAEVMEMIYEVVETIYQNDRVRSEQQR
jgi:hypothetical protein